MNPNIALHDGTTIPQLGFGTWQIPQDEAEAIVSTALEVGYRHIDTAQMYRNEAGVGAALSQSGIERNNLYVTTKLSNAAHRPEDVRRTFEESLEKLAVEYVDLFLIHWPLPTIEIDYLSTWEAMVELVESDHLRSIGVSNFEPAHLDRIVEATGVAPVVNQIEAHPYFPNNTARAATHRHNASVEAWSPLGQGGDLLTEAALAPVATATGKTIAQIVLRWHIQRGDIIFPKSSQRQRIEQNFDIFDFELTDDMMDTVNSISQGDAGRLGGHPDTVDFIPS